MTIPDFLTLMGDENGGVTLECLTCAINALGQAACIMPIAYYGGHGEQGTDGLPYFGYQDLNGFYRFAIKHVQKHAEEGQ